MLQQFRVKSMVSIPLLWALFLMSGHDIRSWADISQDSVGGKKSSQRSLGKPSNVFLIHWAHKIWFGRRIRSKEPTLVSCPDISKWDIPWIRWGKILGAWPLSSKIINRHILLGFVLKIDATKAWKKSIFGCPHMINGTDLERSPQEMISPGQTCWRQPRRSSLSNNSHSVRQ